MKFTFPRSLTNQLKNFKLKFLLFDRSKMKLLDDHLVVEVEELGVSKKDSGSEYRLRPPKLHSVTFGKVSNAVSAEAEALVAETRLASPFARGVPCCPHQL